ncbi:regulatory protein RecX [Allohahella marinimesophila]|uniref:Regulatory protein RecX n=1 Tax=Allohahella marinimesophila TaxID=1054972 RepID=A0ABP7NQL1_9GAMM
MKPRKEPRPLESLGDLKSYALWLLSSREYSQARMLTKLSGRCADKDLVDGCLSELLESNYLSDERMTQSYVRMAVDKGSDGPMKIASKLMQKGIDRALINEYLIPDDEIWLRNAAKTLSKKFKSPADSHEARQKQARFLANRGFMMDQIRYALDNAGEGDESPFR